jgi:hypothetical protein
MALTSEIRYDEMAIDLPPITYHSRLIPEGVVDASQRFLQDAHLLGFIAQNDCRRDRE